MEGIFETKHISVKDVFICAVVLSFLQWLIYQLLFSVKLGSSVDCFAMGQILVVLLSAPYLAACIFRTMSRYVDTETMLGMSSDFIGSRIVRCLFIRLFPILCWILLSSGFAAFAIGMAFADVLNMFVVLVLFSFTAGALGMCGGRIFKDNIFGTVYSYSILAILIGSAFIIKPLDRYIEDLQPTFGLILHLNPVIAVCTIFDGLDILRNPLFYELTPITSQVYSYPTWYMNVFWQLVIGVCSFLWTWWMCRSFKFISVRSILSHS